MCCVGSIKGVSEARSSNKTTRWHLYVGGRPRVLSTSSSSGQSSSLTMSGFVGCLSQLYVNDLKLQLVKAADELTGLHELRSCDCVTLNGRHDQDACCLEIEHFMSAVIQMSAYSPSFAGIYKI